jgi:hypothetical protein
MRFVLERVTAPESEPVSLAEMRQQVHEFADITANDVQYASLITTAREWVEDFTGRALIDQKWRLTIGNALPYAGGDSVSGYRAPGYYCGNWGSYRAGEILLRKSPALSITKFVTVDAGNTETDVDSATYALREADSKWPRLVALNGATWNPWLPGTCMRIEYRAGYINELGSPTVGSVPERFKQAILLYAEALFDRDEKMIERLIATAENLVRPERVELSLA